MEIREILFYLIGIIILIIGIKGIFEKIQDLYELDERMVYERDKTLRKKLRILGISIVLSTIIFYLLDGFKGLWFYGNCLLTVLVFQGFLFKVFPSHKLESWEKGKVNRILFFLVFFSEIVSLLALGVLLLAPIIGVVLLLGTKYWNWGLFWY